MTHAFRTLLATLLLAGHVAANSSEGCCCCTGECVYAKSPPCPCPAPPPGHSQPKCVLQTLKDNFAAKYKRTVARLSAVAGGKTSYPSKTAPAKDQAAESYEWQVSSGWTSGFFPGLLWQLANDTNSAEFAKAATTWTAGRDEMKTWTGGHDIGFIIFGSFGNGLQLGSSNASYASVVVEAAHTLALRYNARVGMTRSWGANDDEKSFEVIIDNLMNLELMFWAAASTANRTLYDMANSHALRTGELWIRADGSTAHLCVFDPKTGKLKSPCTGTPQGLSANSTWARGQGWGIYGFTMAHRFTKDPKMLAYATACAEFYAKHAPKDQVPPWDFEAQAPQDYKDTSSAAITASGLLELSKATGEQKWHDMALSIVRSLGSEPGLTSSSAAAAGASTSTSSGAGVDSEAVLIANQHDCASAGCTVIESDYYLYEALRRIGGHFPPAAPTPGEERH